MEPTAKLFEKLGYGDRLTTGKGETLHIDPDVLSGASDLSNLIPGKLLASIGPVGLRRLGDAGLWKKFLEIKSELLKTKPDAWELQKHIVEQNPGWFAIPRGRDLTPEFPHVRFGYEVPEAKLAEGVLKGKVGQEAETALLPQYLDSPRHYQAYPELKHWLVRYAPGMGEKSGYFHGLGHEFGIGPQKTPQNLINTLNHELEHFVQMKEGWPSGTTTKQAQRNLEDIDFLKGEMGVEKLPPVLRKQADVADLLRSAGPVQGRDWAHVEYRRAAGEQMAEAAATSAAKGGGLIPKSYTSTPTLMYDPHVQRSAILDLKKQLDESSYKKDLADEIAGYLK